jgi:hypothetical protein
MVAGVTIMIDHRRWGRSPPARARFARAARVNPGTWRVSMQELELTAEHDDLDVLLGVTETTNP